MGRVQAGQLRERIVLLTTAGPALPDGRGGFHPGGADVEQGLWARVRPLNTGEKLRLGQTVDSNAYEITLRKRADIGAKQRIRWQGQTLNVQGVVPDETNEYLLLTCINGGQ